MGTWTSDDSSSCTFTFRDDGSGTFKDMPTVWFNSGEESEKRFQAGTFWKPPYISRAGNWTLTQPYVGNRIGTLRFEYTNGNGFDIGMAETGDRLKLYCDIDDPDSNEAIFFHRK